MKYQNINIYWNNKQITYELKYLFDEYKIQNKFYFLYKIVDPLTNQFYKGKHVTKNIFDHYVGSGVLIQKHILSLHDNHVINMHIDSFYKNNLELVKAENKFITEDDLNNSLCLNLINGGCGPIKTSDELSKIQKRVWQKMPKHKKKQIGDNARNRILSYSNEKKQQIKKAKQDGWKNKSEAEKTKLFHQHSIDMKTKTIEEKQKSREKYNKTIQQNKTNLSEIQKQVFLNRPIEEQEKIRNNRRNAYKLMSPEKYKQTIKKLSEKSSGKNNPMYGKNVKDYMSNNAYQNMLNKRSNAMKGRKVMIKNGIRKKIKKEEWDIYLNDGWNFIK